MAKIDRWWLWAGILVAMALLGCNVSEPGISDETEGASAARDAATSREEAAIRELLAEQVAAWNGGDLEGFMEGYLRSEELRFVSGSEVRRGWETALRRYRETYPDRAAMGTLSFEGLDVRRLGPEWAMVFGSFRLEREADTPRGRFTLVLRKLEEGWRIVHDHTSS